MNKYAGITIGILALQGDFERHQHQLNLLGVKSVLVKLPTQLEQIDGLILPGGESTTIDKLMDKFDLRQPLLDFAQTKPIWGTCAGMIMLAKHIENNQANVKPLELIDIDVIRNGYGRQVHSFEDKLEFQKNGHKVSLNASFIRAPKISRIGSEVNNLAVYENNPVLVAKGNILASSFHTELDDETTMLEYFLDNFLLAPVKK